MTIGTTSLLFAEYQIIEEPISVGLLCRKAKAEAESEAAQITIAVAAAAKSAKHNTITARI